MANYITNAELTDDLLKPLVTPSYMARGDKDLQALAAMRGVDVGDIETSPLHPLIVEWLCAKIYTRIALDKSGVNHQASAYGVDPSADVYRNKLKDYRQELARLEPMITAEVLTGDADEAKEFSGSIELFRG